MPKSEIRRQLTNLVLFKPRTADEWDDIRKECLGGLSKPKAEELYHHCFNEPYNHLDVDMFSNKYYKNWNLLTLE